MRPEQIAEIAGYAKSFNQRFGQFIFNAVSPNDVFYVTDEELLAACRDYYAAYKLPNN